MKQSLTLPMADKLYHDKQTYAFIRSVNVSWEKPEKTIIILNTAIIERIGMHLTVDFRLHFLAMNFLLPTHSEIKIRMVKLSPLFPSVLYRANMGNRNLYAFSL